jgi:hypothetical protein
MGLIAGGSGSCYSFLDNLTNALNPTEVSVIQSSRATLEEEILMV